MSTATTNIRDGFTCHCGGTPLPSVEDSLSTEWRLIQGRYSALHGVELDESGGLVRLGGCVPSHYMKQVALAAVCRIAGPRPIVNEIKVVTAASRRDAVSSAIARADD